MVATLAVVTVPATAMAAEGDTVIVSSPTVPQPASVRYAWSSNSPWANLFNKDGLPAQTFRTDDWDTSLRPAPASPPAAKVEPAGTPPVSPPPATPQKK